MIFKGFGVDFGRHFGAKNQSKNEKKLIKKSNDFKTHVPGRIPVSDAIRRNPTGVVWGGIGPRAPRVCRARSVPRNKFQGPRRRKTRSNEQNDDVRNLTRPGPEARRIVVGDRHILRNIFFLYYDL